MQPEGASIRSGVTLKGESNSGACGLKIFARKCSQRYIDEQNWQNVAPERLVAESVLCYGC
jgi:hypothetical protein